MHYLKLVRHYNLLFLVLIQYLIRQFLLAPILQTYGIDVSGESVHMLLMIGATVFIAAGGYVLNDYFDIKIDAINRPEKQIVGKSISKRQAMLLHQALTFIGVVCGLSLSLIVRSFTLAFIFVVVPGLLWFYSASYKRQLIVGNLTIAFISALSILIVPITELSALQMKFGSLLNATAIPGQLYAWSGGFAVFSFLLTWIREIIKDMEDEYGDREMECHTMPIVWGVNRTKAVIWILICITITLLFFANRMISFEGSLTLRYIITGIVLPLIILSYLIFKAKNKNDYRIASGLTKFIMLAGILYAPVFYFLLAKDAGIKLFNIFIIS